MVEFIFEDMVGSLKFDLSERTLRDCIRFCFMTILQKELGGITTETTNHLVGLPTPSLWNCKPHDQFDTAKTDEFIDIASAVIS